MRSLLALTITLSFGFGPCTSDDPPGDPDAGTARDGGGGEDAGPDAGELDAGEPDAGEPDVGADGSAPAACAIVDGTPRTVPTGASASITLTLACAGDAPSFEVTLDGEAREPATPEASEGAFRLTLEAPATEEAGVRLFTLTPPTGAPLHWQVHTHCASCADGSALDGQLAGFEAGAALTEVLGWADARGVARVGVARTAAGGRIAQALDLELGFGAAVPLSERGEVVLTGGTGDVQAQLVDVAPGEGGAITATARDLPAGSLGFGDVKLLPTTSEPITEVYDALPLRAGDVQGVAALAGLPGGGLLLDVSSVGVESRRYASLGAWNADTPWARFALVRLRGIGVAQPTVGDLGALVLVGDPASGRYQLQILTLPIVGEPTLLARLEITDAPTPDEGWLVPEPSAQLALGDPDGDGDVDLLVLLGFGREARLVVFELTGDDWAPRAHPLPALPLRAAFERCGDGSCRREAARRSGGFDEDVYLIATPDLAALRVPVGGSVEGVGEIGLAAELRVPARGGDAEWSAVDATAQEGSDGRYPMGPEDTDGDGVPDGRRTWVEQEARSAAPRVLAEAPMGTVGATVAALGAPEGGRLDVLANGRLLWSLARADDAPGAAPALPLEAGELLRGLPTPLGRATFLVETRQIEDGAVFRQVVRRSGDRVERGRRDPSVWFYPGSTRLRAIGPCGDGCPDGQEVSWVDEEGVLQLGRIDPGSVAMALAGEGPLTLVEGSTVALGAAPTGADLGLDVLPGTLAETTRPQRVSTWALPFATDPEDPPAPPGRPVREELVAVHAWDTGTACPLALLLYPDGDATAEPEVVSTSDAEDCGGLELPVATSNGGGALGVFVFAPSSIGAAAMLVTGPWATDARTEVSLSIWGRQPTQSDPEPRVRRRPDLLQAEWDELIDESVEMLRENPLQGMAVGDVDGDGLDDVWQDRSWLESGRPTLRLGGGPAGGLREERAAPPVRRFKGRGPIQLTGRTSYRSAG